MDKEMTKRLYPKESDGEAGLGPAAAERRKGVALALSVEADAFGSEMFALIRKLNTEKYASNQAQLDDAERVGKLAKLSKQCRETMNALYAETPTHER